MRLISQPGSYLMYVGDIAGLIPTEKLPFPCISHLSVRSLPMMISQPLGCEKSFVIIIWVYGILNLQNQRSDFPNAESNATGASAVSVGYSKTWHMIFMIAGNDHFSEAKSANIQSIGLCFLFEK
jgi:hypothetical protein